MRRTEQRSARSEQYRHLYKTARWQKTRARQLAIEPLCRMCANAGRTTPATVCDHIDPKSKLDPETFFAGPFQSLCDHPRYRCHSSRKARIEARGYEPGCDRAGRPTDPNHPWRRAQSDR